MRNSIERRLSVLEGKSEVLKNRWRVTCFDDLVAWEAAGCPGSVDLDEASDEFLRELVTVLEATLEDRKNESID